MESLEKKLMSAHKALVRVENKDAALLTMLASDEYRFEYLDSYVKEIPNLAPVSLTLPLRTQPYLSMGCLHPFFDNLLFEGEQLRLAERKFNLNRRSPVDRFKLLMLTGYNTLSAVSVLPFVDGKPFAFEDSALPSNQTRLYELTSGYSECCPICLKDNQGVAHPKCQRDLWDTQRTITMEAFSEDPINIFRTINIGQSISGAQRKALFSIYLKKILRRQGFPQYIIKPEGEFPEMPANEHLTMSIAREIGFNVPPVGLYRVEGIGLICIIKRFDWSKKTGFQPTEDFAQLNEELAERKDQATLEQIARSINMFTQSPPIELAEFFRRVLFCFLIGNGDMHLKNWSLYREAKSGFIKLSPLYDYLNVRACFPQEQVESVLSINAKQNNLSMVDFREFGLKIGLNDKFIHTCFKNIPNWAELIYSFCARSALSPKSKARYLAVTEDRFHRLSN